MNVCVFFIYQLNKQIQINSFTESVTVCPSDSTLLLFAVCEGQECLLMVYLHLSDDIVT